MVNGFVFGLSGNYAAAAYIYCKGRIPAANLVADLRERVASRSKASCKLASNLLQTKSILAAMKKRKHSTWVKQYIRDRHRYDAYSTMLPEMKANDRS